MMQLIRTIVLLSFLLLSACNQLDDYFLGKDNTPIPKKLPPITHKVSFEEIWHINLGKKSAYMHEKLSPVVSGTGIYAVSPSGLVQKSNIKNGDLVWKQWIDNGISSGPTVASGVVALGMHHSGVAVLNQATGKLLWEQKVLGEVLANPLIIADKVIVKTVEGHLYAFHLTSGKKLWHVHHGSSELILKASSSPVMNRNGLILVGFADGKLDAVIAHTGELAWQKGIIYGQGASDVERLVDIDADPIVYGDTVLLASYQGFVVRVSLDNGEVLWKQPASVYQNMTLSSGKVFFVDDKSVVWAISSDNGQIFWRQVFLKARDLTSPVVTPLGIIVADKTGLMHILSAATGATIGQTKLNSAISMNPVTHGNMVYVLTVKGQLYAFRLTGKNT